MHASVHQNIDRFVSIDLTPYYLQAGSSGFTSENLAFEIWVVNKTLLKIIWKYEETTDPNQSIEAHGIGRILQYKALSNSTYSGTPCHNIS